MMPSPYSESSRHQALLTLDNISETIIHLEDWNKNITSTEDYYSSQTGMQLLAANCTLITAIGEGINRINRILPGFLETHFPEISWRSIIGMRNHIAHGYFDLDADLVFDAIRNDIPTLSKTIAQAIHVLSES